MAWQPAATLLGDLVALDYGFASDIGRHVPNTGQDGQGVGRQAPITSACGTR